jgi:DNA mismatch repair protein MSH2
MELEAALVILSPKEVLMPSIAGDYTRIKEIMDRNNMLVTTVKKNDFSKTPEFCQDLEKLYRFKKGQQKNIHAVSELKMDLAMGAVAAGLKYLETIKEAGNLGKFAIKTLTLDRFVHMDSSTFSAMHLFPPPAINYRNSNYKWQSVLGVLDRCQTSQGRRMLHTWLKQPLRDLDMINERLNAVECLADNQEARIMLNKELNCIPDVLMLTNKLLRKRSSLHDIFKIYQVIVRLPSILKMLKELNCNSLNATVYNPLNDLIQDLTKLEEMVDEVIDMESVERGEYLVRASFDDKLNDIKSSMSKTEKQLESRAKKYANTLGLEEGSTLKLDYASHLGFFLRANRKEDQNIRKHKQFRVIDTARNMLRFTTDDIAEFSSEYNNLKESYEEQQKEIVAEICRVASGYSNPLTNLNHIIATLDVFLSFAQVATNSPGVYVRPKMYPENERILQLSGLRHPCLEHQEEFQYIPNDVDLKADESEFLIITGANISGKSTYIRSIGIAVLLAQIGSFVPCDEAKISICDSILARIGAADDIQKNLSTFAMEMVETSAILKLATKSSLIIIDELGRGTSTFEGKIYA